MMRILEISWLLVSIIGIVMGVYKSLTEGFLEAIYIFIFTIVALIFYMMRRRQRISLEAGNEESENDTV